MMFNALSMELYSLKQRLGDNVAEYGVNLSHQVQIVQSEYPGRIAPKHVEEMKHDHFYEGLNPEYQWMLAHNVDSENPAVYSDLLAAWRQERRAEARDPLPPKTAVTSGLNVWYILRPQGIYSPHTSWRVTNTFTAWLVAVAYAKGEAESGTRQKGRRRDGTFGSQRGQSLR